METQNHKEHTEVVRAENERRRLKREEEERIAWENSERRRLKLEWKLRRRENRRLNGLEKAFMDQYLPTADIEKDILNIANLDGADSSGLKVIGLRGGLLGEVKLLVDKVRKLEEFADLGPDWPLFDSLIQTFWNSFVGEGFTITMGVDPAFERNISPHVEGVSLDNLEPEFLNSLSEEQVQLFLDMVVIHYVNGYRESQDEETRLRREKRMEIVKFVEKEVEPDGDGGDADGDDKDNSKIEAQINEAPTIGELVKQAKEVSDKEGEGSAAGFDRYFEKMLRLAFNEAAPLRGARLTRQVARLEEPLDQSGVQKNDDGDLQDQIEEIPRVPKVLVVFLPAAAEEDLIVINPPSSDRDVMPSSPGKPDGAVKDSTDGQVDGSADVEECNCRMARERKCRKSRSCLTFQKKETFCKSSSRRHPTLICRGEKWMSSTSTSQFSNNSLGSS